MIALGALVLGLVTWWLVRRGALGAGSMLYGALIGLMLAGTTVGTSVGAPLASAMQTSADALGTALVNGVQAGYGAVVK